MKCLVTGGAGFIGSHLQDRLISLGHEVAVLDNLRSGKREYIHPNSSFFEVDIREKELLKKAFEKFKPEIIFHLAAQNEVPYSMTHPYEDQEMNIVGMMNLLELSHTFGIKQFIYSNTGGAFYGEVSLEELPIKEDHPPTHPTSFYGVSKLCAEVYLRLYGQLYKLPWISLRYSNVYGPRQDGNKEAGVVAIFTSKLLAKEQPTINGDGSITRDYIFVDDVVDANIAAMSFKNSDYFNIATEVETSTQQVFDAIEQELQTGIKPTYGPHREGDPLRNSLSIQKAKQFLNWQPTVHFKEGIHKTIEFYKQKNKN